MYCLEVFAILPVPALVPGWYRHYFQLRRHPDHCRRHPGDIGNLAAFSSRYIWDRVDFHLGRRIILSILPRVLCSAGMPTTT